MTLLDLTPDELLSTTRAVRKRLDFERPVERELLDECLALAQQAPNASNSEPWRFVVVTEAGDAGEARRLLPHGLGGLPQGDRRAGGAGRPTVAVLDSAQYLADRFHEVPVMVLPCLVPRADTAPVGAVRPASTARSSRPPGAFSSPRAREGSARAGRRCTCPRERDAAEVLGIPYERVQQVALITLGYSLGTDFKPGRRVALERVVRYERWR